MTRYVTNTSMDSLKATEFIRFTVPISLQYPCNLFYNSMIHDALELDHVSHIYKCIYTLCQVEIVRECSTLGRGYGGFYQPTFADGRHMRLQMMCLGKKHWDATTNSYVPRRQNHDNATPPAIPEKFSDLVKRSLQRAQDLALKAGGLKLGRKQVEGELPNMDPTVCIVNFYEQTGALGMHQVSTIITSLFLFFHLFISTFLFMYMYAHARTHAVHFSIAFSILDFSTFFMKCIALELTSAIGTYQDKDESAASLKRGSPVVSFSVGDSGIFAYGKERDPQKAEKISLESGDVLIFGGPSRMIFHGVESIIPKSAPKELIDKTNIKQGRLNLTFREL